MRAGPAPGRAGGERVLGRAGADPADGCDEDRLVRAHLSRVAEPGDPALPATGDGRAEVLAALRRGRGPEVWQARHDRLDRTTPDLVAAALRTGIGLLVPGDPAWPVALDDLAELAPRDAPTGGVPTCLWVRGDLPVADAAPPVVALVGCRACSAYGEHVAADLAAGLVERGWTVLSGAAYGIDGAAHRGAVAVDAPAGTPTVAVLAGGVDRPSPQGHADLLQRVLDAGGAWVSEHPPGVRPAAYRFLLRNRLIAAWAAGVVVVEASARSGALNTARTAVDLSRHVAAVPGPVTSATSVGTNQLLRDGAACVTDADEVVELLGAMGVTGRGRHQPAPPVPAGRPVPSAGAGRPVPSATRPLWPADERDVRVEQLGPDTARVWQELRHPRATTVEALVVRVGLTHRAVAGALAALELEGVVERVPSGWRRGAVTRPDRRVVP